VDSIIDTLQQYKEHAEAQGLLVYAIALKGSQNYNLSDEESDIDANLVFIPTLSQLRTSETFKFTFETGDVVCHNIYKFVEIVAKGNPQWIEVCQTEYVIGDLSAFRHYSLNPSALKGMMMEKVHAFSKLYPSRKSIVEKHGWDPKQLHHIIRLYDTLNLNVNVHKYSGPDKEFMLDVKRGRFPDTLNEAEALRDTYVKLLGEIYEERKLVYKVQPVDYDMIDKIVMRYLCNE